LRFTTIDLFRTGFSDAFLENQAVFCENIFSNRSTNGSKTIAIGTIAIKTRPSSRVTERIIKTTGTNASTPTIITKLRRIFMVKVV
jgi:hypothetical protein